MHLQSDAVAQAVAVGVFLAGEGLAGAPVDGISGLSGFHQRHGGELRLPHRLDHAGLLGGWLADDDSSRRVAVVPGRGRPEIHHHHVASLDNPVGGAAVRKSTALPGGDDGLEGWAVGPELAESLLQQEGDIPLAKPGPDGRANPIEGTAGDRRHRPQQFDLLGLLHDSEFLDQARGRHQRRLGWQRRRESLMLVECQVLGLEADPPQPQCLDALGNQRPEAMRRPRWHESEGRRLGFHLQPVAAVPQDFRGVPGNDEVAEAAGEPG